MVFGFIFKEDIYLKFLKIERENRCYNIEKGNDRKIYVNGKFWYFFLIYIIDMLVNLERIGLDWFCVGVFLFCRFGN